MASLVESDLKAAACCPGGRLLVRYRRRMHVGGAGTTGQRRLRDAREVAYHRRMSSQQTTEERLTKVEQELAELKRQLAHQKDGKSWIERIAGTFENDPDFDDIVRLGREFRDSAP
ncbi:MAG: hypothetical protein JXA57_07820 [Armatimonadetes bacterium]|nr:hypothetical protein [Armatimonadota bacterium]